MALHHRLVQVLSHEQTCTRKNGLRPPSSVRHSISTPNLVEGSSSTSNKSLVEWIQASLGMDVEKYDAFIVAKKAKRSPPAPPSVRSRTNTEEKRQGRISDRAESKVNNTLTAKFLDTVKKLQLHQKFQEEEVEMLSKDGYRVSNDKPRSSSKQSKKKSEFHRVLLEKDSAIALDLFHKDANPEPQENGTIDDSFETILVRGVWQRGGAYILSSS